MQETTSPEPETNHRQFICIDMKNTAGFIISILLLVTVFLGIVIHNSILGEVEKTSEHNSALMNRNADLIIDNTNQNILILKKLDLLIKMNSSPTESSVKPH